MSQKTACFACTGCGLGQALDMARLKEIAADSGHACVDFFVSDCLCGGQGLGLINQIIREKKLQSIVIAACSSRSKVDVFSFAGCLVARVNLRELVVWAHQGSATSCQLQAMTQDYLRMGLAMATKASLAQAPVPRPACHDILVIGGGVTGMAAALDAAGLGRAVTLVEKQPGLGGWAARMRGQIPSRHPYQALESPLAPVLAAKVLAHPQITVKTHTVIGRIAGEPGDFFASFQEAGQTLSSAAGVDGHRFGAVILAAGWVPGAPPATRLDHLLIGRDPDVITNTDLEQMAWRGKITRPSTGKPATSVVFVQSPGTGDDDADFDHASHVTHLAALKQARYVVSDHPGARAFILYQHMRAIGLWEGFYESVQQDPGVFMTRGSVLRITRQGASLVVEADAPLFGQPVGIRADLVVLGLGMEPATARDPVLNLAYSQGPGLRDTDAFGGYAESAFMCFPYQTRRAGIYAAGAVRRAMTILESMEDASGAALKAVSCTQSLGREHVAARPYHTGAPELFLQTCTLCQRCTEECPFGALDKDEKGLPRLHASRCQACGVCMGACPERLVSFPDFSMDMVSSQIKSIHVPLENSGQDPEPRILAFVCENDALPALDMAALHGAGYPPFIRFIPVRCLGCVNVVWIKDALIAGMDGVLLIGCRHGEDYQCHFALGSQLAATRLQNMQEALDSMALERQRLAFFSIGAHEYHKLAEILSRCVEQIMSLGPNPFKGL